MTTGPAPGAAPYGSPPPGGPPAAGPTGSPAPGDPAQPAPTGHGRMNVQVPDWVAVRTPLLLATVVLGLVAIPRVVLVLESLVREHPGPGTATLVIWGLYALPLLALILSVDYFEREPWTLVAFAFVWGGFIATGLALSANDAIQSIVTTAAGPQVAGEWGAALAGPTTEEILKGLGIVMAALLARRRMRSPVDGFILGAVVGLGFQVVEDVVYTANVLNLADAAGSPGQAIGQMFVIRGLMAGLWSHAAYSGLVGLGIGYALTRPQWSAARRVAAVALGFLAAWGLHFLWNSPLLVQGIGWELVVVKGLPTILLLLAVLVRAQRADSGVFLPALAGVRDPAVATDEEVAALTDRRSRRRARLAARDTRGRRAYGAQRRLQRAQADLAVALTAGDLHGAEHARERITEARSSLGELTGGRPVSGRGLGAVAVVLGVAALVVPVLGAAAALVAVLGLARARAAGAPPSARLWWGLGLGLVGLLLLAVLTVSVPA